MRPLFDWIERILKMAAVTIVIVMLLSLVAQVFLRYVFGKSLSWSEEVALLGFAWVVVISSAIGIRRMTHARMDLLVTLLPHSLHFLVDRLIALMMMGLGIFMTVAGWDYVEQTRGSTSAAIGFPIEFLYASAPVFGVLITIFSFERLMPWAESLDE
jgi:TRAP-type C4-dicarboxylate transport system permease small subunit